jgi:hypothetical protein
MAIAAARVTRSKPGSTDGPGGDCSPITDAGEGVMVVAQHLAFLPGRSISLE